MLAAVMFSVVSLNAQEFKTAYNESIDENGHINRGAYLTNPVKDNWTFGIGGGVQFESSKFTSPVITPAMDIYVTKWFTPVIAARFGYTGFTGVDRYKDGFDYTPNGLGNHAYWSGAYDSNSKLLKYNRSFFHVDVMWNFVNTIWGYQYNRFFTSSLYFSGGYMRLAPGKLADVGDNEFAIGLGLYNAFRLTDHFTLTLDIRSNSYSARYQTSEGGRVLNPVATIGIAYTLNKWYWNRSRPIEVARDEAIISAELSEAKAIKEAAKAAVAEAKEVETRKELEEVREELAQLKVLSEDEFAKLAADSGTILYYEINVAKLSPSEQKHFDEFVSNTLARDPHHIFEIIGSADKGTGTEEINQGLSAGRAENIKELLMKKHNVPEDRIVIKEIIISDEHEDGSYDRCAIIK